MLAVIEIAGTVVKLPEPPLHPVEEMLFGRSIEVQSLHPDIREIYSGAFQQLDEMDKVSAPKAFTMGPCRTDLQCGRCWTNTFNRCWPSETGDEKNVFMLRFHRRVFSTVR